MSLEVGSGFLLLCIIVVFLYLWYKDKTRIGYYSHQPIVEPTPGDIWFLRADIVEGDTFVDKICRVYIKEVKLGWVFYVILTYGKSVPEDSIYPEETLRVETFKSVFAPKPTWES